MEFTCVGTAERHDPRDVSIYRNEPPELQARAVDLIETERRRLPASYQRKLLERGCLASLARYMFPHQLVPLDTKSAAVNYLPDAS